MACLGICCSLQLGELLGEGAFGKVYKGYAFGIDGRMEPTVVAVKMQKGIKQIDFLGPLNFLQPEAPHSMRLRYMLLEQSLSLGAKIHWPKTDDENYFTRQIS